MKSTFSRLFTSLSLIFLAATILISVSFQWIYNRYLTNQAMDSLQKDAAVISELLASCYSNRYVSAQNFYVGLKVVSDASGADAVICDVNGKLLMCADSPMGCAHTDLQLGEYFRNRALREGSFFHTGMVKELYPQSRHMYFSTVNHPETGKPLAIVMVSSPVDKTLVAVRQISNIFLFIALLVLIVSVVVMTIFVRRQSNPLRDMAKVAKSFAHGNFSARVTTTGRHPQEVEDLALAFNNMAASLEKSEYHRQEFVANVSHELKTPMTSISGYVDGILDGTIPPEKSRQYLELVSQETKRLNRLVRSMLDISRLQEQGGLSEERKSRFDLSELAGQVLISFEKQINDRNIDVQVQMPEHPVFTWADRDAINQVIYNLVDNGVKFCNPGGQIGILIQEGSDKTYLTVFNDGPEIPAEELPLVFERFHKADKSRSQNRDSWGLGLYIVKTILDSHGENISVTSQNGCTAFTFTLPLVR